MTAINVIRQSAAVHVITDGAALSGDGKLVFLSQKAFPISHLNLVIAVRGPKIWLPLIADCLASQSRSYNELKTRIVEQVRSYYFEPQNQHLLSLCEQGIEFDL